MRIIFGSVNLLTILFFDGVTFRMHDENKRGFTFRRTSQDLLTNLCRSEKGGKRNASKIVCQTFAKFYLYFSQIKIVDTNKLLISFRCVMNAVSVENTEQTG